MPRLSSPAATHSGILPQMHPHPASLDMYSTRHPHPFEAITPGKNLPLLISCMFPAMTSIMLLSTEHCIDFTRWFYLRACNSKSLWTAQVLLAVVKQDWLSPMQVWFAVDKEKKTAIAHICMCATTRHVTRPWMQGWHWLVGYR